MSYANHIKASWKYVACNIGQAGSGKLGIFKAGEQGRKGNSPYLAAHGSNITDFEFSPFFHDKLLTAADDCTVKLWSLPADLSNLSSVTQADHVIKLFERRVELLLHHPIASSLFTVVTHNSFHLFDFNNLDFKQEMDIGSDPIQSACWSYDGRTIACTTKDKQIVLVDPRVGGDDRVTSRTAAHANHKDSRICWISSSNNHLLSTGFGRSRNRELRGWDARNMSKCCYSKEMDTNTGVLMPFHDPDTDLVFVLGKGDSSLMIMESTADTNGDFLTEASSALLSEQTKGACLSSKFNCDVMKCEVNQLLQLSRGQISPVMVQVPRRVYREFQPELFPYTANYDQVQTAQQWIEGGNAMRNTSSLDPDKQTPTTKQQQRHQQAEKQAESSGDKSLPISTVSKPEVAAVKPKLSKPAPNAAESAADIGQKKQEPEVKKPSETRKVFQMAKTSKYRHWLAKSGHPSTHYTNIQRLSTTVVGSGNNFDVNKKHAAIPMSTPGGHVAVIQLSKQGRQPGQLGTIENGANVVDFAWNPFDDDELAVALDTGVIRVWHLPVGGLQQAVTTEGYIALEGHYSRVSGVAWHPLASGVLATCGYDSRVVVWRLDGADERQVCEIRVNGGNEEEVEVLQVCWSADGRKLASLDKNGRVRVHQPRENITEELATLAGGCRNGRLCFVDEDRAVLASYINKSGARCVVMMGADAPSSGSCEPVEIDHGVALLIPHYDEESKVLFLAGKGDHSLLSFQVDSCQAPEPLQYLSAHRSDGSYQAWSMIGAKKGVCDVGKVEVMRGWKLNKTNIEPVSFTVPRVKMEYFQDDLFPDAKDRSGPTMSATQWLSGENRQMKRVSMKPEGMKSLSEAPKEAIKERKYESFNASTYKTDEQKREELVTAMSAKLNLDKKLEQDEMEGVDEDEWSD